jgi:hypothetical protein
MVARQPSKMHPVVFIAGIQGIRQSHKLGAEVSNTSSASIFVIV